MKDIKEKVKESWENKFSSLLKEHSKVGVQLKDNTALFSSKEGRDLQVKYEKLEKELLTWKKEFSLLLEKSGI